MNEQRLAEALRAAGTFRDGELVYFDSGTPRRSYRTIESAISALDAAGLLVTDLHKRALEACEDWGNDSPQAYVPTAEILKRMGDIGRESLAAKEAAKPKPRWTVRHQHNVSWVDDRGTSSTGPWTEDQAKAIARVLNELGAAK